MEPATKNNTENFIASIKNMLGGYRTAIDSIRAEIKVEKNHSDRRLILIANIMEYNYTYLELVVSIDLDKITDQDTNEIYVFFKQTKNIFNAFYQNFITDGKALAAVRFKKAEPQLNELNRHINQNSRLVFSYITADHYQAMLQIAATAHKAAQFTDEILELTDTLKQETETVRELANQSSIGYLAKHFSDLRTAINLEVVFWGILMTGLAALTSYQFLTLDNMLSGKDISDTKITIRATMTLALTGGIYWIGRNLRAALGRRASNEQRIATIRTFKSLAEQVKDDQDIKNIILSEAAKTIFAHTPSGYTNEPPSNNSNTTIDISKLTGSGQ